MPKLVGAGLECRHGTVSKDAPVKFHVHRGAHFLTACGIIHVQTKDRGEIRMNTGDVLLVWPEEEHQLTVPHEPARYSCVGIEGLL